MGNEVTTRERFDFFWTLGQNDVLVINAVSSARMFIDRAEYHFLIW